ncbi:hypothetical protein M758_UG330900 [Ceratodon purpureus]|nr:hypothetical protein M758_UG330900 [Ceratodon purpureus]
MSIPTLRVNFSSSVNTPTRISLLSMLIIYLYVFAFLSSPSLCVTRHTTNSQMHRSRVDPTNRYYIHEIEIASFVKLVHRLQDINSAKSCRCHSPNLSYPNSITNPTIDIHYVSRSGTCNHNCQRLKRRQERTPTNQQHSYDQQKSKDKNPSSAKPKTIGNVAETDEMHLRQHSNGKLQSCQAQDSVNNQVSFLNLASLVRANLHQTLILLHITHKIHHCRELHVTVEEKAAKRQNIRSETRRNPRGPRGRLQVCRLPVSQEAGTIRRYPIHPPHLFEKLDTRFAPVRNPEVRMLMEASDVGGNGTLNYGEFVAATVHLQRLDDDEHLRKAFDYFDADGSGYIETKELREVQ